MRVVGPARGPFSDWRRVILCGATLASFCAVQTFGQDVAEAARQEKARKAAEQESSLHVYTEEDLKRTVILTPEDKARVEARKRQENGAPAEQNAEQQPNDASPLSKSLGEIARRYRQEKAEHEAELAAKEKFSPFLYEMPDGSLAAPKLEVGPLNRAASRVERNERVRPFEHRPAQHFLQPAVHAHGRISPFQPRPFRGASSVPPAGLAGATILPSPPAIPPSVVQPMEKASAASSIHVGLRRVEVQRGQSWWKLAELYLGSGARWQELRNLNVEAGGPPELLKLGSTVVVPEATKRQETSSRTIEVQKGDSLWSLAHEYLGRGSAWTCLAGANPQVVDYTRLAVRTSLQLPANGSLEACQSANISKARK